MQSLRKPGHKVPLSEFQKMDLNHAMDYAVSLLARRDYSTHELKKKLAERGYTEHAYGAVVVDLQLMNKVNDERYGQNFVAYRARRGHGPARIRNQLQKSGLSRSTIDEAVKGGDSPDFLAL
ncbi:MAG: regulatory protein RecX, partial [Steroidobacteraceae bacterium]|nr:regulatory protein RecX [Steroidobacteraceae bacterium]